MSAPKIEFANKTRDEKHVSDYTLTLLRGLMSASGVSSVTITSTYRSEKDQARVMLNNLKPGRSMYKGAGQSVEAIGQAFVKDSARVQQAAHEGLKHGFDPSKPLPRLAQTREATQAQMESKIKQLQLKSMDCGCVSRHQQNPNTLNVIDFDPVLVLPNAALSVFIAKLTACAKISRVGLPAGVEKTSSKQFRESVHSLHIEVPQPSNDKYAPKTKDIMYA